MKRGKLVVLLAWTVALSPALHAAPAALQLFPGDMSTNKPTPAEARSPETKNAPPAFVPGSETTPEGCTIEKFFVHSPSMGRDIRACVVLPPEYAANPDKHYPVLYTFHGSAAPFNTFSEMVPLRQKLKDEPMIVTCFDADSGSMYIDSSLLVDPKRDYAGPEPVKSLFTTFFLREFIPAVDKKYRIDPKKRMLTGFSMGGFGAFHYMLAAPGEFVSVSTMSGYFPDWTKPGKNEDWLKPVLGDYAANPQPYLDLDLRTLIEKQLAAGTKLPPIYMTCGTEDFLLDNNRQMHAFLIDHGVSCEYREGPGSHTWPFWRDHSAGLIDFHWSTVQGK